MSTWLDPSLSEPLCRRSPALTKELYLTDSVATSQKKNKKSILLVVGTRNEPWIWSLRCWRRGEFSLCVFLLLESWLSSHGNEGVFTFAPFSCLSLRAFLEPQESQASQGVWDLKAPWDPLWVCHSNQSRWLPGHPSGSLMCLYLSLLVKSVYLVLEAVRFHKEKQRGS